MHLQQHIAESILKKKHKRYIEKLELFLQQSIIQGKIRKYQEFEVEFNSLDILSKT